MSFFASPSTPVSHIHTIKILRVKDMRTFETEPLTQHHALTLFRTLTRFGHGMSLTLLKNGKPVPQPNEK